VIRALVFDWGGVIQRTEDPGPRRSLANELGISPADLDRAVFESDAWHRASIGRMCADEAWGMIAKSVGWPSGAVDGFVERFFAGDRLDDRIIALIRHLRGEGIPVGLLSNAVPDRKSTISRAASWGMPSLFDEQVFSYQVGALKPQAVMYWRILGALGVAACDALLVDDAAQNVAGARVVGMEAILFSGTGPLLQDLRRRRIPAPASLLER